MLYYLMKNDRKVRITMNKKDILEIKRRFKKEACTFTRMCGCYVDADRNKITKIGETFLNLEDEEFYKYLEIAKKVLSGTIGNNLLELEFPLAEEAAGGRQQFLMGLRESRLKNDDLMDTFYDMIIDSYDYVGNYLILIFHDAYDVMTKTSDNDKLDESEEVYEYLLCAICPVNLTKPGLGYREDENRIGPRIRDWVVGAPDTGFVFPAFTDRSTDIHSVMFYTRSLFAPRGAGIHRRPSRFPCALRPEIGAFLETDSLSPPLAAHRPFPLLGFPAHTLPYRRGESSALSTDSHGLPASSPEGHFL